MPNAAPTLKQGKRYRDNQRPNSYRRGYSGRWRKVRNAFLLANPLCVECLKTSKVTQASEVDHIKPHKGDYKLMWDKQNLQSLCTPCHSTKTATEDGGFGNKRSKE